MFKKTILALTSISVISLSCFASGNSHQQHKSSMSKASKKELSTDAKRELGQLLKANEELHSAFLSYDAKMVEEKAKIVKNQIEQIKDPAIIKVLKFSGKKLGEIKASFGRDKNNENYHIFSSAFAHVLNKYDHGTEFAAYYCPMVKKNWIQKVGKVKNPYAPNMVSCGGRK